MGSLSSLVGLAGTWTGPSRLWMSPSEPSRESQSVATVTPVVRGKFVWIEYTWAVDGETQEGILVLGYEAKEDRVTAVWIDSWHMGDKFLVSRGTVAGDGTVSVLGSYAAPPGPDWGWRTVIEPGDGDSFRVLMYNVMPDGKEMLAVEANYRRQPTQS